MLRDALRTISPFAGSRLALALAVLATPLAAQNDLSIDDLTLTNLEEGQSIVRLSSDQAVEAFFLAFSYDPALLAPGPIQALGAAIDAEGVFSSILPGSSGVVVAVIVDNVPPFDGQTIPAGSDLPVASIGWLPAVLVTQPQSVTLEFQDGVFDNPPVTNSIVQDGGISITQAQGLVLSGGTVTILPPPLPTVRVEPGFIPADDSALVEVSFDNPTGLVDSYTVALEHPLSLQTLAVETLGTVVEAFGAEFVDVDIAPNGVVVEVVFDSEAPFDGQALLPGSGWTLALIRMQCLSPPLAPDPPVLHAVTPVNGVVGNPAAVNRVSIGGIEISPSLEGGVVSCLPVPFAPMSFLLGTLDDEGNVGPVSAAPGDTVPLTIFYTDPVGGIQGVQIAICADCDLNFVFRSFSAIGMALDEAEFLLATYDNNPSDGDGCEMTIGALLDAIPPFDGATLPITTDPIPLGQVEISISPSATPFACLEVQFCDFIDGGGGAPIENVAVIDNESVFNFAKIDGLICLDQATLFRRGDVNTDGDIDLADPIVALIALTSGQLPCFAAADIDGDGLHLISDPILLLEYLFGGGEPPVAPYESCGVGAGEDCADYGACP